MKCVACDEHLKWLAVGSNNDVIATLHPHTGEVLSSWKTADFSVSHLCSHNCHIVLFIDWNMEAIHLLI